MIIVRVTGRAPRPKPHYCSNRVISTTGKRTDHKNQLFLHENSSPMIVRWFMALSQYSYEIEFISGIDNGIANSMSRLCRNNMTELPHVYTTSEILCSNIIEKFKLTPFQYKTISSLHHSTVGHFGLERTMKRLNDINQKWEFQRQNVRWFIDHCPCCQKMRMLKMPLHAHGFTTSTYTPNGMSKCRLRRSIS
jgi:Integrase zinc binding domain